MINKICGINLPHQNSHKSIEERGKKPAGKGGKLGKSLKKTKCDVWLVKIFYRSLNCSRRYAKIAQGC